ncbi:MAG: filamentous hemagglutinin N-terminal domain-containing protein [Candidatus Parabeggiatoa sp.]|nr:filamentous hemagglutinin N-terminal domain-containing protein [Candidatus Parabeggiatoa sp.]
MCKYSLSEKICRLISLIIAGFIFPSYAEITLDGSLGAAGALPGPDYMIGAELGSRAGNNLFHSFGEFNINTGESATFTGPAQIANIIGRVTGGNYSLIDGALNATIPNADLYLLNPSGVIMGANATLNIDGAFHLSSTDYLQFADGQRFEANTKVSPVLTVASPKAFGFLEKIGNIRIVGRKLENGENDFSVTAGNLQIINSDIGSSTLDGQAGDILLQTAGSLEIIGSEIVSKTELGGQGSTGNIILNSPIIGMGEDTRVGTRTLGTGNGGNVQIAASQLITTDNSAIFTATQGTGLGGDIVLNVGQLEVRNNGRISTTSQSQGHSGQINIRAENSVTILGNKEQEQLLTAIDADANAQGNGGKISLSSPILYMDAGLIQAGTFAEGNAGNIHLNVDKLELKNKAAILASSKGIGHGGHIEITGFKENQVVDEIKISGGGIASSAEHVGNGGTIDISATVMNLDQYGTIQTLTEGKGDAGDINIDVNDLSITDGADIDASNEGNGYSKSGQIDINATGNVLITAEPVSGYVLASNQGFFYNNHLGGIYSIAKKTGHGGNITLSAGQLTLRDNGVISAKSTAYAGDAGNINLKTNELHISEGWIDVSSELGLNGEFILNSTKLKDTFLLPPPRFQNAQLSLDPCANGNIEKLSRFSIISRDGLSTSPEDLKTHLYIPEM